MDTKTSVTTYINLLKEKDFVYVVFFRGHWCPFCMTYLTELETIRPQIEQKNGSILAVTAEDESKLSPVKNIFTGQIISDPQLELATYLRNRDLIDVAITPKDGYPKGMAQPGVLVMQRDTRLYSWAIQPSVMNLGGAKDRPSLIQIHENVLAQVAGREQPHKIIKKMTFWQGIRWKIFG